MEVWKQSEIPDEEVLQFYNSRYFFINMTMLRYTGLWPYQNKLAKIIMRVIFTILIIISMIPQIICVVVFNNNVEIVIQAVGIVFYFITIALKFFSMLITEKKMKILYETMVQNWKLLESQAERDVLEEFSETGRLLTIVYVCYMVQAMTVFVCLPVAPRLVNMVFPLFNESLTAMFIMDGEYLVDKQEYYYYIYLFEAGTVLLSVPMYSTVDSTYAVCVQHCVGLLAVVKLRLELATKESTTVKVAGHHVEDAAHYAISKSAELHEKVLNFGRILESSYSTSFLFVVGCASCTLVSTSVNILFNLDSPVLFLRHAFVLVGFSIHMFYLSWPGQKMIDSSNDIFYAAYNNEWYNCSVQSQQLLKLIMRRTATPFYLTAGGFYTMNFVNFAMLMKTSLSYITVLASFK